MKVLCVIDHFGSGGAQRQMVNLAVGLKERGHDVEMFIYFPQFTFFRAPLDKAGIPVHEIVKGRGASLRVLMKLIAVMRAGRFEVVVSYLDTPNVYTEIAHLFESTAKLIVSERASHHADKSAFLTVIKRSLHGIADCVVANSDSHRDWLRANYSWLRTRCISIHNGVDAAAFAVRTKPHLPSARLRLIAVGRVGPDKNVMNTILGLQVFHDTHGWVPEVSWVGRREDATRQGREYCRGVDALLAAHPKVQRSWHWLGERSDMPALLSEHDALIHPGYHDGLSNVICEALAAGCPVIAADMCDNARLVKALERGFLFDPTEPESIAAALADAVALSRAEWQRMSEAAREYAITTLTVDRMVTEYEWLFGQLVRPDRPARMTAA